MTKIDYSKIKIADRVDYAGPILNPICIGIRTFSAGAKNAFNKDIRTHTGIVVEFAGQYLVCGMRKMIALESLEDKEIVGIYRHPNITDEARLTINKQVAIDFRRQTEYNYTGLGGFVLPDVFKDTPNHFFCSQYYVYSTKPWIEYIKTRYAPQDLTIMADWEKII